MKSLDLRIFFQIYLLMGVLAIGFFVYAPDARAQTCTCLGIVTYDPTKTCGTSDCDSSESDIEDAHNGSIGHRGEKTILEDIQSQFTSYRDWLLEDFFDSVVVDDLREFTQQMSVSAMNQAQIIGQFFDARQRLQTESRFQELQHEAFIDYQPSESFCQFGTMARSLASSHERARYNAAALNARQIARQLGEKNVVGSSSSSQDKRVRWERFTQRYCDPQDQGWSADFPDSTGLASICEADDTNRVNADIDYMRVVELSRSLNMDFTDLDAASQPDDLDTAFDREDVMALADNLYGHDLPVRALSSADFGQMSPSERDMMEEDYLDLRPLIAQRAVAQNSFNAIVSMKSAGTDEAADTREFLGAILKEVGVPSNEIYDHLGESPSYYAQLELLAKTLYQNPEFYAGLYDTPADVDRKSVALKAIELMLDRAIYESELRQELTSSVLLSRGLADDLIRLNSARADVGG